MDDYNTARKICEKVYNDMCDKLQKSDVITTLSLCNHGLESLKKECDRDRYSVFLPPSVCLNNIISNFIGQDPILPGDVVKITLGVKIGDSIYIHGDTFTRLKDECHEHCLTALKKIVSKVKKAMIVGNTTDDVKITMEKYASLNNIQFVENCTSYEHYNGMLKSNASKYIIANYVKYYDDDDTLIHLNDCFEFEKGEVYTIVLNVYSGDFDKFQVNTGDQVHLAYINQERYNLKLKSSREFYSNAKKKYTHNVFRLDEYTSVAKYKVGIKECIENGILEPLYIETIQSGIVVYSKIFTIMIQ